VLAALESVDLATIFDETAPLPVVEIVRPETYVKGGDYDIERIPEAALARSLGGRTLVIPFLHDRSTTQLLARVRASARPPA
jgi:bifunctional ADP-heptose synthase (sugar kinase/adenylyltransferase)